MAELRQIRTDVVGSLLRPDYLKDARQKLDEGKFDAGEFEKLEDRAVAEAVARAAGGVTAGISRWKWQATKLPPPISSNTGSSILQRSRACGHRVWKRQPEGGLSGLGTSPSSSRRSRGAVGSGTGIAESSAWV